MYWKGSLILKFRILGIGSKWGNLGVQLSFTDWVTIFGESYQESGGDVVYIQKLDKESYWSKFSKSGGPTFCH